MKHSCVKMKICSFRIDFTLYVTQEICIYGLGIFSTGTQVTLGHNSIPRFLLSNWLLLGLSFWLGNYELEFACPNSKLNDLGHIIVQQWTTETLAHRTNPSHPFFTDMEKIFSTNFHLANRRVSNKQNYYWKMCKFSHL